MPCQARDWNEEYQSLRELPSETIDERIVRDQALHRLTSEFVQAAAAAAVAVVHGNAVALDTAERREGQVFLYNNIFLAFATSARQAEPTPGADLAAHAFASKERLVVAAVDHVRPPELATLLNAVVDYAGHRVVAQAIMPGTLRQRPEPSPTRHSSVASDKSVGSQV